MDIDPVRFAEKINQNTVSADLLSEKNTILTGKNKLKRRNLREANIAIIAIIISVVKVEHFLCLSAINSDVLFHSLFMVGEIK